MFNINNILTLFIDTFFKIYLQKNTSSCLLSQKRDVKKTSLFLVVFISKINQFFLFNILSVIVPNTWEEEFSTYFYAIIIYVPRQYVQFHCVILPLFIKKRYSMYCVLEFTKINQSITISPISKRLHSRSKCSSMIYVTSSTKTVEYFFYSCLENIICSTTYDMSPVQGKKNRPLLLHTFVLGGWMMFSFVESRNKKLFQALTSECT